METRKLGNSDLNITRIGLGAWAIGGAGWQFGWGPQDDQDSMTTIQHALDLGINWIDTAALYGLGHSEEIVGQVVKGRAERPYIFTKCQRRWRDNGEIYDSLKAESIREEVENSLRRLQVDVIDLYQIHWPRPDEDIEEGWTEMAKLKEEGKIRHIAVSNFSASQMQRAHAIAPITSLQPPYSMIRRDIETDILPFCQANNIGVIVYSPMASGLLTGKMTRERASSLPDDDWRSRNPQFQEPLLSRNLGLVELITRIGQPYDASPAEVAIAWTLRHPAVTAAIVGARRPDQVDGIIGAAEITLSDDDMAAIESYLQQRL